MAFYVRERAEKVPDRPLALALIPLSLVLVVVVSLFLVFFTSYGVVGDSMVPTLLPGDRLFATRDYDDPAHGSLVLVRLVVEEDEEVLVKRVLAVPGDEVQVQGDTVYVNGEAAAADSAIIYFDEPAFEPFTVPHDRLFVAGDNRPVSLDSRQFGTVPRSSIVGEAVAIFLPIGRMGAID